MRDILAEIVEKKKDIVANAKREMPLDEVKRSLVCGISVKVLMEKVAWCVLSRELTVVRGSKAIQCEVLS